MPRTVNGFTLATLPEKVAAIRADLEAAFPGEGAYIRGAVWYAVAGILGGATYVAETMRAKLAREMFASTCSEPYLTLHAAEYLTPRNPATACKATVQLTWTAAAGDLPAGTILVSDDGTEYTTDAIIVDPGAYPGTASGAVTCSVLGSAASVVTGATLTLATPIAGITSAGVVTGTPTPGADQESVEEWRVRVLAAKRTVPDAGTSEDYHTWCMDVDGVERAWISRPTYGTVQAIIYPGGYAGAVQTAVDLVRNMSGDFQAVAATTDAVIMSIEGYLVSGYTKATVSANITNAVNSLYAREGAPGGTIRNSDIRAAIASAEGLDYYIMSSYNGVPGGLSDYTSTSPDVPIVGVVTWAGDLL